MTPKSDVEKIVAKRPGLKQVFYPARDITEFMPFETGDGLRVKVNRGLTKTQIYPLWKSIPEVVAESAKPAKGFEGTLMLSGIGLGYIAEGIAKELGEYGKLAIWEPDLEWLRAACYFRDLTELFMDDRVTVLLGGEAVIERYLVDLHSVDIPLVAKINDTCLCDIYPERRQMMDETLQIILENCNSNRKTLAAFREQMFEDYIRAVKHVGRHYPAGVLKNIAAGIPAVVCGGGPSLMKALPALRKRAAWNGTFGLAGVLVLACDTAAGVLIENGIKIDFVFSVDPQKETAMKYENLAFPSSTSLVYNLATAWEIPANWKGRAFYTPSNMPPWNRIKNALQVSDMVGDKVQCQMHLAVDVANFMGCTPIMLTGVDLCYYSKDNLYAKLPRYIRGAEDELFNRSLEGKDIHGNPVMIPVQFKYYRQGLEARAKEMKIINCNGQGVEMNGIEKGELEEMLERYTHARFIDLKYALPDAPPPVDLVKLKQELKTVRIQLRRMELLAKVISIHTKGQETPKTRDWVGRWTAKAKRTLDGLDLVWLLSASTVPLPVQVKRTRSPILVDELKGLTEWVQAHAYYSWLWRAAELAREEYARVEAAFNT